MKKNQISRWLILAMLTTCLPAAVTAKHGNSKSPHKGSHEQALPTVAASQTSISGEKTVPDCTVEFSGKISLASLELEYKCSSTQANCTMATNDAFNCLTAVYQKARRIIMK